MSEAAVPIARSCVLAARGLCAGYGSLQVVAGMDIEVTAGEVTVLLGPNGAGKTTTLQTLAGALAPLAGCVEIDGRPTRAPLHRRARNGLALVSEQRSVLMRRTVAENLRVGPSDAVLAFELFPELREHRDRQVSALSGGQQQMLALARALSRRPTILLADELSLGLAPLIVDRLLRAVRAAADTGLAVLLVEQHVRKVLAMADRGYVLVRGQIALAGTATELLNQVDDIQASYIGEHIRR